MAFDDRNTGFLTTVAVIALTAAVGLPVLQRLQAHGWISMWVSIPLACLPFVALVGVCVAKWRESRS